MYEYEMALMAQGYKAIAGVDEVGRGPLAGPVIAGAVILNPADEIVGIDDSKRLSANRRTILAAEIKSRALAWATAAVSETEIDDINIYQASRKAMMLALAKLGIVPDHVLSDAMPLPDASIPFTAIIHGDRLSASIGAASIIAKVERDALMDAMDLRYPGYGFRKNKGYPTPEHLAALTRLGITPIHRKTYHPVRAVWERQISLDL
ncbi:MAG: ribonuclease HII [bacterium]